MNKKQTGIKPHLELLPYEKCMTHGVESLTDAELLAVILRCGKKGESALSLAGKILGLSPDGSGLLGLCHLSHDDYMSVSGIGYVKSIQLECIGELSKRLSMASKKQGLCFRDPGSVASYFMELLRHKEKEHMLAVMLDTRNRMIKSPCISTGTVNASLISTRDLFIEALKLRAVSMILIHNHPSGDPSPSEEDLRVTDKVIRAGELMDIRLMDHIIIGDNTYVSLSESDYFHPGSYHVNKKCIRSRSGNEHREDLLTAQEPPDDREGYDRHPKRDTGYRGRQ